MKLFYSYLKECRWFAASYLGLVGMFFLVFYLYDISYAPFRYAFLLSSVWLVFSGVIGFLRYERKHRKLLELEKNLQVQWEQFPQAEGIIEEDYQRMMKHVFDNKKSMEEEFVLARQDMSDYYSLWAHQIKTPISAMRMLLQSQEEMMSIEYNKMMKAELFKIEQYVDMVLSYLRIESMASDLVLQWLSLEKLVKQAIRKYSQLFILQKSKLELHVENIRVLTDEKWLVFVIGQILSNALKYTKQGRISIYTENKMLVIEDTGIGIQAEDLPRIFERGFTGYNGRSDKKSTGIGLYLCKCVMDKLSHGLSVESTGGKGTKVYLILDRKELINE